jgi:hypothetical protein
MRTYNRCRFSSDMSSDRAPTWADADILIRMSPVFLITMSLSSAALSIGIVAATCEPGKRRVERGCLLPKANFGLFA